MRYQVILSPIALANQIEILEWITERSLKGAKAWQTRWEQVVASLKRSPESCGLAPETEEVHVPIHQILFKTRRGRLYRALFAIRPEKVIVLSIRGASQTCSPRKASSSQMMFEAKQS